MKKIILGNSGITSIVGYLIAGLMAIDEITKTGETSWIKIVAAVGLAIFGRFAKDAADSGRPGSGVIGGGGRPQKPEGKP